MIRELSELEKLSNALFPDKGILVEENGEVKRGTIVQFYDCPSSNPKSKSPHRWMRGKIIDIAKEPQIAFLIVRENGRTYLSLPKDIKRDTVSTPFKIPKDFVELFAKIV